MSDSYGQREQRQPAYDELFSMAQEDQLTTNDMYGVQTAYWDITLDMGITLEKLQRDHYDGYIWQLPEESAKEMRHNTRVQDRINATEEDLDGDHKKGLILAAEVVSHWNNSKVPLSVDIDSLLPRTWNRTKRTNWTIQANCPQGQVFNNMNIFDPNGFFTRRMYEKKQRYNMNTLNDDIKLEYDRNKQWVAMPTRGVGWEKVLLNWNNPAFETEMQMIRKKNPHIDPKTSMEHEQVALVPYELGEAIHERLAEPLKVVEKSYTDLSKTRTTFTRADGEEWNSLKGLIGDAQSYGKDSIGVEVKHNLYKPIDAGLKLKLQYVLEE